MIDIELNSETIKMLGIEEEKLNEYNEKKLYDTKTDKTIIDFNIPNTFTYNNTDYRITKIDSDLFRKVRFLKTITFPDTIEEIPNNAFENCYELQNVTFGKNIKTIGKKAFKNCFTLKNLNFNDNLEIIDEEAFYNCQCLEKITLSKNLKVLSDAAFMKCKSLKEINFNENLKSIGAYALYYTNIEKLTLPNNLEEICEEFIVHSKRKRIVVQAPEKIYNKLYGSTNWTIILEKNDLENLLNKNKSFKEINKFYKDIER